MDSHELITRLYRESAETIADLLVELSSAEAGRRRELYLRILRQLQVLQNEVREEVLRHLHGEADKFDERLLALLLLLIPTRGREWSAIEIRKRVVSQAAAKALFYLDRATNSIRRLAGSLAAGNAERILLPAVISRGSRIAERPELRRKLRNGMVAVSGRNSKLYRYEPEYYADLVLTQTAAEIGRDLTVERMRVGGLDLVQISPQPSTIGDFCDLYRGKVFSISGTHPIVHPISVVPNGGAPMHVRCHHFMYPYPEYESVSEAELRELGALPESFVALGRAGGSTQEFMRLWTG